MTRSDYARAIVAGVPLAILVWAFIVIVSVYG